MLGVAEDKPAIADTGSGIDVRDEGEEEARATAVGSEDEDDLSSEMEDDGPESTLLYHMEQKYLCDECEENVNSSSSTLVDMVSIGERFNQIHQSQRPILKPP